MEASRAFAPVIAGLLAAALLLGPARGQEAGSATCSIPQSPRNVRAFDQESKFSIIVERGADGSIVYQPRAGVLRQRLYPCGQHYHCRLENSQGCDRRPEAMGPGSCKALPQVGDWIEIHTVYAVEVGTSCDRESLDCCKTGPLLVRAFQAKVVSGSPDAPFPDPWARPLYQWSGSATGPDDVPYQCKAAAEWSFSPGCAFRVTKQALAKRLPHPHSARGVQPKERLSHDLTRVVPP